MPNSQIWGSDTQNVHCESDPEANTHQIHSQILAKYTVGVCCCWQTGWSHSKHFHVKSNLTISISGLEGGHMTAAWPTPPVKCVENQRKRMKIGIFFGAGRIYRFRCGVYLASSEQIHKIHCDSSPTPNTQNTDLAFGPGQNFAKCFSTFAGVAAASKILRN